MGSRESGIVEWSGETGCDAYVPGHMAQRRDHPISRSQRFSCSAFARRALRQDRRDAERELSPALYSCIVRHALESIVLAWSFTWCRVSTKQILPYWCRLYMQESDRELAHEGTRPGFTRHKYSGIHTVLPPLMLIFR